jgi:hypothetical protein
VILQSANYIADLSSTKEVSMEIWKTLWICHWVNWKFERAERERVT